MNLFPVEVEFVAALVSGQEEVVEPVVADIANGHAPAHTDVWEGEIVERIVLHDPVGERHARLLCFPLNK